MKEVEMSPIEQFIIWYREAKASGEPCLDAMTLATSTLEGAPSARVVLFKGLINGGFTFYTNYQSRKGSELLQNPRAAMVFYWPTLERQVRIEGDVKKVSAEESDRYFQTRPRGSQIGAWASLQSTVLSGRDELEARVRASNERFSGKDVSRPDHWGGFSLMPCLIEFWQGREDRLHERMRFQKRGDSWKTELLFP